MTSAFFIVSCRFDEKVANMHDKLLVVADTTTQLHII